MHPFNNLHNFGLDVFVAALLCNMVRRIGIHTYSACEFKTEVTSQPCGHSGRVLLLNVITRPWHVLVLSACVCAWIHKTMMKVFAMSVSTLGVRASE